MTRIVAELTAFVRTAAAARLRTCSPHPQRCRYSLRGTAALPRRSAR